MPFSTYCPACREPLEVDEAYRTWTVRCPSCGHEFTPDPDSEPLAAEPAEELRGDRPRRRRRRMSDEEILERAKRSVAGPASWLRVIGGLSAFCGILGVVGTIAFAVWFANNPQNLRGNPNAANQAEMIVNLVILGVASAFSVVFGGLLMYGAMKMGRLESHGWAMAASVLPLTSVVLCGICGIATVMPFGIWALVALARPDVQEGFKIVKRRKEGRWEDEDGE
jgi:hypothetical protein